jgi:hypothetical protein
MSAAALCGTASFHVEGEEDLVGWADLGRCFSEGCWDDYPDFGLLRSMAELISSRSRPGLTSAPDHNRTESLARAPLGKLSVQRRYGSLGSGGQQMPVHLVSDVDVPMSKEVSKFGDLYATSEHR